MVTKPIPATLKKVGKLCATRSTIAKQTNKIKIAAPLLDPLDLDGVVITAAHCAQLKFARYLIEDKLAHYHFTVKAKQTTLLENLQCFFKHRKSPDAIMPDYGHGSIDTRKIWVTCNLRNYLDFPCAG